MNKRQKAILIESLTVIAVTITAVVTMINFKDWVNRSEAMRAMEQLQQIVFEYRKTNGAMPSEAFVTGIRNDLKGGVRLGDLQYRAIWIDFIEATPNEILAYTRKKYPSSLLEDGYVVLRLDGSVQWMSTQDCEQILAQQQSQVEKEILRQKAAARK